MAPPLVAAALEWILQHLDRVESQAALFASVPLTIGSNSSALLTAGAEDAVTRPSAPPRSLASPMLDPFHPQGVCASVNTVSLDNVCSFYEIAWQLRPSPVAARIHSISRGPVTAINEGHSEQG